MKSDFFKAYKCIIRKIINSDGIENLSCKERKKILKLLNENPLLDASPTKPPVKINPFELYYTLYLDEYTESIKKRKTSSVSFKYVLDSSQSQASGIGHYNAMSVRTLTNSDGTQRIKNMYIMFKGFRSPNDVDSNEKDENGVIIKRDLKRLYLEEFEITKTDDNGVNIGGLSGQLQYQDEGTGTATSVSRLIFPISYAYGIWKEYKGGYIDWQYDNSGLYLRKLTVNPPDNEDKAWANLSSETALVVAGYKTIVGFTANILDGSRENIRTRETNLGRMIADSALWFAKKYATNNSIGFNVDIALKHSGGIHGNISGPNITRSDIMSVSTFNDLLVIAQLDANQLVAVMENSISRYPSANGRFSQIAGITIEFDPTKPGVEGASTLETPSRITNMSVTRENGKLVDKVVENGSIQGDVTRLFGVAFNNYMFVEGDGYSTFMNVANNSARKIVKTKVGEQSILEKYITEELKKNVDLPSLLNDPRISFFLP
jgi:hypothetical protein